MRWLRRRAHRYLVDQALGARADEEFRALLAAPRIDDALLGRHAPRLLDLVAETAARHLAPDAELADEVAAEVLRRLYEAGPQALPVPAWQHLGNEIRDRARTLGRRQQARLPGAEATAREAEPDPAAAAEADGQRQALLSRLRALRPLLSGEDWALLRLLAYVEDGPALAQLLGTTPLTARKRKQRLLERLRRRLRPPAAGGPEAREAGAPS